MQGRALSFSSLCPAFLTSLFMKEARKEPLNESLENQHYDAPCAQQSPTSFNGLRPEKPLQAVFVHDRLEGRTGLAQAQPASQRCICGMSKKRDNTSVQSICAKLALVLKDA